MAVVATLSKGYDLDYIWRQVDRGLTKDAAGYYIQASESGGEPPGRWWGPGAKALGLEHGQVVERERYDLLFGGTQLGRPPGSGQKADTAPRLTRADAARALGAGLARLEDTLAGRGQDIPDNHPERTGLSADQAAAALSVLTDGKRVSVINAPAGSGKTRVLAEAARVWAAAGRGPVVGITPSQSARNTLAAGVAESCNTAQFLGHLPGQRGARGPFGISEGTLLLADESSMIPTPDLSDLVSLAEARSGKVILAGDTGQLQAVENGGAMSLLAGALGYARLADPVRFRAAWEQAASLRLRTGDASVLAEYDQHGRIIGGEPEQMIDAAAAAYVALTLDGTDTLLMAAEHGLRRELSRRIRDDLIHLSCSGFPTRTSGVTWSVLSSRTPAHSAAG